MFWHKNYTPKKHSLYVTTCIHTFTVFLTAYNLLHRQWIFLSSTMDIYLKVSSCRNIAPKYHKRSCSWQIRYIIKVVESKARVECFFNWGCRNDVFVLNYNLYGVIISCCNRPKDCYVKLLRSDVLWIFTDSPILVYLLINSWGVSNKLLVENLLASTLCINSLSVHCAVL